MVKLINFLELPLFNNLRSRMKAPITNNYKSVGRVKEPEIEYLTKLETKGIEVKIDEITVEKDETLSFNGQRILVHIMDVHQYGNRSFNPKFHFSNCDTLKKMKSSGKWAKYVASHKDDGYFHICYNNNEFKFQKLDVCKNCLELLRWNNFSLSRMSHSLRTKIVNEFSIKDFFKKYPKTLLATIPTYTSDNAPRNDYTSDWPLISSRLKTEKLNQCEICRIHLINDDKKFLHVHHINGLRNDNSKSNLKVLCIRCHSNQPNHSHIEQLRDYNVFMTKFYSSI